MLLTIYPACLRPTPEPPLSSVDAGLFVPGLSIVPLKLIEYGVNGVLIIVYPKPYSTYLRGTIERSQGNTCGIAQGVAIGSQSKKQRPKRLPKTWPSTMTMMMMLVMGTRGVSGEINPRFSGLSCLLFGLWALNPKL